MTLAYHEYYKIEDHQLWKGDCELIKGMPYAMSPSPLYDHQYINGKIFRLLDEQLDNCTQYSATIEMNVILSEDTVVRPDTMVICYEPEKQLTKAPNIVFEVISKSTARRNKILKLELYQSEGVDYYILVYPEDRKAKLFQLIDFKYQKFVDFTDENYLFKLDECEIIFDFTFIWRK